VQCDIAFHQQKSEYAGVTIRSSHNDNAATSNARAASPDTAAIIVAAGKGVRAGGNGPKQYQMLGGKPVLARTIAAFIAADPDMQIILVTSAPDALALAGVIEALGARLDHLAHPIAQVDGGATRQASVMAGLEHLAKSGFDGTVLIHDGARPFVSQALIRRAVAAGRETGAAVPALPVTDTIKQVSVDGQSRVEATLPRATLCAIQTPQAFTFATILAAHRAASNTADAPDDAALVEAAGGTVTVFDGEVGNFKLTSAEDFIRAEAMLEILMRTKVTTGYDVHAFCDGDHVWLGGIRIAHSQGVLAHSDGDVVLHAATDALLGIRGDGDIGTHFPPGDPQWRAVSSDRFLAFAAQRLRDAGGIIDHLDISILAENPKVGPHRTAMQNRIAQIAGVDPENVSVKATTSEKLGFIGRSEGLAAFVTATVRLPITRRDEA
jgi:2-C-methyl-D-erythritol 4-phosphate cytidylyltransferase / 2-C-methyl-D-erythritol 2,4-cyclodiphosphate synthase